MLHPEMKITAQGLISLIHCQNTLEGTWPNIYICTQTQRDNNMTAKHKPESNLTTAATRNQITASADAHIFATFVIISKLKHPWR